MKFFSFLCILIFDLMFNIFLVFFQGICIIFAPRRSGTLDKFVWKAQKYFNVTESIDYDTEVTDLHETLTVNDSLYTPDIHFPIYLMLTKLK